LVTQFRGWKDRCNFVDAGAWSELCFADRDEAQGRA
jgi:hypothetical protein